MFVKCKWCNCWSFSTFCDDDCEALFYLNLALEELEKNIAKGVVSLKPETLSFSKAYTEN